MNERELKYGEARKRARLKWANSEHGKELSKNYMKEYRNRPEVKAKYHEYYVKNKEHWGEIKKARESLIILKALYTNKRNPNILRPISPTK